MNCNQNDPSAGRGVWLKSCDYLSRKWTVDQIEAVYSPTYPDAVEVLKGALNAYIQTPSTALFDNALVEFVNSVVKFGYLTRDIVEADIQGILNQSWKACDPNALAAKPLTFTYTFDFCLT